MPDFPYDRPYQSVAAFGPLRVGYQLTLFFLDVDGAPRQIERGRWPLRSQDVSADSLRPADIHILRAELLSCLDELDQLAGRFENVSLEKAMNFEAAENQSWVIMNKGPRAKE